MRSVSVFDPVDIDLDGKGSKLTVDLKESESVTVSGTVLGAKGKPIVGQSIGKCLDFAMHSKR